MNSTSKLFFSSLVSKSNLFNLLVTIAFAGITLAGIWLVATNQYQQFLDDLLLFSGKSKPFFQSPI